MVHQATTLGIDRWWVRAAVLALALILGTGGCTGGQSDGYVGTAQVPDEAAQGYVSPSAASIAITDPWVRAGAAGRPTAAYMVIRNTGAAADRLVGVRTDAATVAQVHESRMEGTLMKMVYLEAGLEVPVGAEVALKPESYHIMLIELARDLKAGDTVALTLTFEQAGDVTVIAPVLPISAMGVEPAGK